MLGHRRRALTPTGTLLSNGGGHQGGKLARVIRVTVASMFVRGQGKPSVKAQNHDDLVVLAELVGAAKITPVVDRSYALAEAPEAIARVGGRARARDGGAQRVAGR